MILNPHKHQAMVLSAYSSYAFSFSVKNSIDLLGVTTDKDLSLNRHISQICETVNKQSSFLKRFKNIITRNVMWRLLNIKILLNIIIIIINIIKISLPEMSSYVY